MSTNPKVERKARAVTFSPELMGRIFERIASGRSLNSVCKDDDMPAISNVMRWISESEELQEKYARARDARADLMAEEILEIADDANRDYADEGFNSEHVQRSRLRVDARKWLLAKMAPRKYGDRVENVVTGPDGGAVVHKVTVELVGTARSDS